MKKQAVMLMLILPTLLPALYLVSCKQQPVHSSTANEIVEAAIEAITDLDTYRFIIDRVITVNNERGQADYVWDFDGAVNGIDKQMYQKVHISFKEATGNSGEYHEEEYLVDSWLYEKFNDDPWRKSRAEYYWGNRNYAVQQLDTLTNLAPAELIGTDTIDEIEYYKMRLQPSKASLWSWITSQTWSQVLEGHEQELTEEIIGDCSIFQWIAKDTYFLTKSTIEITFQVNSDTITYHEIVTIYHLNEPVSITLPPETGP